MGAHLDLPRLAATLRTAHGPPRDPPPRTAFEWIVWDNVAYLADDATRALAFADLRARVGLTPAAIADAEQADLEAATSHGMLPARFAEKLRAAAQRTLDEHGGDLDAAVRAAFAESPARALRLLGAYPGVGQPGAERILLFLGLLPVLALDSNGLRVLVRLGAAPELKSYGATYHAVRDVVDAAGAVPLPLLRELHLLLQTHGRTICRRTVPECPVCALRTECAFGAMADGGLPIAREMRPGA
jgi:endonuclease III